MSELTTIDWVIIIIIIFTQKYTIFNRKKNNRKFEKAYAKFSPQAEAVSLGADSKGSFRGKPFIVLALTPSTLARAPRPRASRVALQSFTKSANI
jgi:hypothetical protein